METELYKIRNVAACIKASYDLFSTNITKLLKRTWLPILVMSILLAVMQAVFTSFGARENPQVLTPSILLTFSLVGIVIGLALIAVSVWLDTTIVGLLNGKSFKTNFPRVTRLALVNIGIVVLAVIVIKLLVSLPFIMAKGAPTANDIAISYGLVLAFMVIVAISTLPLGYGYMKYVIEPNTKLHTVFGRSYCDGWRYWGYLFVLTLLAGILLGLLYFVVMMPSAVIEFSTTLDRQGIAMGDQSGMPSYIGLLSFVTTMICAAIWSFMAIWLMMVYYYAYGHIEAKIAAKKHNKTSLFEVKRVGSEGQKQGNAN
ncbi:MAG: hypothetical protein PHX91_06230 [Prevotella sp.]|nr:hypothetical protein [Prevotella sp.]